MRKVLSYGSFELIHNGEHYYWQSISSGGIGHFFTSVDEAMRWIRNFANSF
jgi:hypothetical protein